MQTPGMMATRRTASNRRALLPACGIPREMSKPPRCSPGPHPVSCDALTAAGTPSPADAERACVLLPMPDP